MSDSQPSVEVAPPHELPVAPAHPAPTAIAEAGKDVAAPASASAPAAGATLTEEAAVAIFVAKHTHTTRDSLSCKLASQYGITSKSVRGRCGRCPGDLRSPHAALLFSSLHFRPHTAFMPAAKSRSLCCGAPVQTSGTCAHGAGQPCHTGRQPTSATSCPRGCVTHAADAVFSSLGVLAQPASPKNKTLCPIPYSQNPHASRAHPGPPGPVTLIPLVLNADRRLSRAKAHIQTKPSTLKPKPTPSTLTDACHTRIRGELDNS